VEFRFNAEAWRLMTREQRIQCCAQLAEEALKRADRADGRQKSIHLDLANRLLALAEEMLKAP
jgi:hypothetical protein